MPTKSNSSTNVFGATLTRRQFVKAGGMLAVGISVAGAAAWKADAVKAAVAKNSLDPALLNSWLEIHPDNTVLIRRARAISGRARCIPLTARLWPKS